MTQNEIHDLQFTMVLQWSSPLEVLAPVIYTNMIITVMINYQVIIILEAINIYDNDNGGINPTGRPTSYNKTAVCSRSRAIKTLVIMMTFYTERNNARLVYVTRSS